MFDNEIDWVMRIWHLSLVPAAQKAVGRVSAQMTQYKAEHKQWIVVRRSRRSVQCKKSVFRSAARERVSVASCSQADNVGYL